MAGVTKGEPEEAEGMTGGVLTVRVSLAVLEGEGERVVVDLGGVVVCSGSVVGVLVCIVAVWSSVTSIGTTELVGEVEEEGKVEEVVGAGDDPFSVPFANFRLQQSNTSFVSMLTCSVFLRTSNSHSCLLGKLSSVAWEGSSSSSEGAAEKRSGNWAAKSDFESGFRF